jgi:transcriptional regulator with XRE-family HTH domain
MAGLQRSCIIDSDLILTEANSLAHLFVSLRANKGISRERMAKRLGISEKYLSLIETGKKIPSTKVCSGFAKILDINEFWLRRKLYTEIVSSYEEKLKKKLGLEDF